MCPAIRAKSVLWYDYYRFRSDKFEAIITSDQPIPYPQGVARLLLRLPVWGYRLGLGDAFDSVQIMALTTRGRTSGLARHTAIEYRQHGSKVYVISAWGQRPHWYQNLIHDPHVMIQRGSRLTSAVACPVTDAGEALRVLHLFRRRAPGIYDAIIARLSDRTSVNARSLPDVTGQITIVRLDVVPGGGHNMHLLPGITADTRWVLPTVVVLILLLLTWLFVILCALLRRTS